MMKIIFSILLLPVLALSCKQDDPPTQPAAAVKYMTSTTGSTWDYELVNNLGGNRTLFMVSATGRDTPINSKAYHVFTNNSGPHEYYIISGNEYYNYRNLPAVLGGSSVENIYLKDNVALNDTWSKSYPVTLSGIPLYVTLINTITEKGQAKTINNISYTDVIKVTTTFSISGLVLPPGALTTDIHAFYAPKYGMIESKNKIDINYSGIVDHTDQVTTLKSADLK